jgi:hypothetical protein
LNGEEWTNHWLQVWFDLSGVVMQVFDLMGQPFLQHMDIAAQLVQEKARSQALAEKLRELGVDPDGV